MLIKPKLRIKGCFTFQTYKAIKLDGSKRQWIDLGIVPEACLAQPDTCSDKGGSVALWVKVAGGNVVPGIISSRKTKAARGFQIGYTFSDFS